MGTQLAERRSNRIGWEQVRVAQRRRPQSCLWPQWGNCWADGRVRRGLFADQRQGWVSLTERQPALDSTCVQYDKNLCVQH